MNTTTVLRLSHQLLYTTTNTFTIASRNRANRFTNQAAAIGFQWPQTSSMRTTIVKKDWRPTTMTCIITKNTSKSQTTIVRKITRVLNPIQTCLQSVQQGLQDTVSLANKAARIRKDRSKRRVLSQERPSNLLVKMMMCKSFR